MENSKKIVKVGYLSFYAQVFDQIIYEQDQLNTQLVVDKFAMITLEDWSNIPQNELEENNITDPKNVVRIHIVKQNELSQSPLKNNTDVYNYFKTMKIQQSGEQQQQQNGLLNSEFLMSGGVCVKQDTNSNKLIYEPVKKVLKLSLKENQEDQEGNKQFSIKIQQISEFVKQGRVGHSMIQCNQNQNIVFLDGNSGQEYLKDSNLLYQIETNKFKSKVQSSDCTRSRACYIKCIENDQEIVYAIGGFQKFQSQDLEKKIVSKYNITEDKWEQRNFKGLVRIGTGAWGFQHPESKKVYVVGGLMNDDQPTSAVFCVEDDGTSFKAKKIGDLKYPRINHQGSLYYNQTSQKWEIIVVGGQQFFNQELNQEQNQLSFETFQINQESGKIEEHSSHDTLQAISNFYVPLSPYQYADSSSFIVY